MKFNPDLAEFICGKYKRFRYTYIFCNFLKLNATGNSNLTPLKIFTCLSYMVDTIVANGLVMQRYKASATMALTQCSINIAFSAGFIKILRTPKSCTAHIGHRVQLCIPLGLYSCHGNIAIWSVHGMMLTEMFRNVYQQHCFVTLLTMTHIVQHARYLGLKSNQIK